MANEDRPGAGEELPLGTKCWYVPDLEYWGDTGTEFHYVHVAPGPPLSLARQAAGEKRAQAGDVYTRQFDKRRVEAGGEVEGKDADGNIMLRTGELLRPLRSVRHWPAVVAEEHFDRVERVEGEAPVDPSVVTVGAGEKVVPGHHYVQVRKTRLVLEVRHPHGHRQTREDPWMGAGTTLHIPLDSLTRVDGKKAGVDGAGHAPHSYYVVEGQ